MRKIYVPTLVPESWQALLADPEKQWKIGFSARAVAHSWEAANGLPPEIADLFGDGAELLIALPEHKVSLGDTGRPSQTDVFALVKSQNKTIAVAIEGKVDESFGPTIKDWYVEPSPAKQQRLKFLCDQIEVKFEPINDHLHHLHYQLFHRTASAILEAERFKTDDAAMIVHSFSGEEKGFAAYAAFLGLFDLTASPGELVSKRLSSGRTLYFGWAKGNPIYLSK
jgi:hypothetical protein